MGELAGRVSRALAGFSHPGLDRVLQWDLRYGTDVVAPTRSRTSPTPTHRERRTRRAAGLVAHRPAGRRAAAPGGASGPHRRQRRGPGAVAACRTASSTSATCRTRWAVVRTGDHRCPRCSATRAPTPPRSCPAVKAFHAIRPLSRGRGRRAVAAAGAAHRGAHRQRGPAGRSSTRTTPTSPSSPMASGACSSRPPPCRWR